MAALPVRELLFDDCWILSLRVAPDIACCVEISVLSKIEPFSIFKFNSTMA